MRLVCVCLRFSKFLHQYPFRDVSVFSPSYQFFTISYNFINLSSSSRHRNQQRRDQVYYNPNHSDPFQTAPASLRNSGYYNNHRPVSRNSSGESTDKPKQRPNFKCDASGVLKHLGVKRKRAELPNVNLSKPATASDQPRISTTPPLRNTPPPSTPPSTTPPLPVQSAGLNNFNYSDYQRLQNEPRIDTSRTWRENQTNEIESPSFEKIDETTKFHRTMIDSDEDIPVEIDNTNVQKGSYQIHSRKPKAHTFISKHPENIINDESIQEIHSIPSDFKDKASIDSEKPELPTVTDNLKSIDNTGVILANLKNVFHTKLNWEKVPNNKRPSHSGGFCRKPEVNWIF